MSMLAEPRRKQKWNLNPRGKQWSEDSNKFGQKMLEKMGWTSGKGLGANEQGMTEYVRVAFKNDVTGIGFKKDNLDKAWTEHQDGFNDFLQELQRSQNNNVASEVKSELSGKSLELKSKHSRARVHYQKFTRGKDVNKYSSKDIANIFGQKELNTNENCTENQSNNQASVDLDPPGTEYNNGGVTTINGGIMTDYFMKKNQNFSLTPRNKNWQETNSESEPEYAGFGFAAVACKEQCHNNEENKGVKNGCDYAFENPYLKLNSPDNISNSVIGFKSSKTRKISDYTDLRLTNDLKKFKDTDISKSVYKNSFVNTALNLECVTDEVCSGKIFEVSRTQLGVTNSALDLGDEVNDKKRVTFNDHVEYSTDSVNKKKGKTMLDKFEVENKKIKRKKKQEVSLNNSVSSGFVNEALDIEEISEELNDNNINERKSKSSKKRKRSRRSNLETIVEIPEEDKEACEDEINSKKLKVEENVFDNVILLENISSRKAKKKKKKIEKTEKEIVTAGKNDIRNSKDEPAIEIKTFEREECELNKYEDKESFCKEKKKKMKPIEQNLEKYENIIFQIETETNNTDCMNNEVEQTEAETVKLKKKKKIKDNTGTNDCNMEIVNMKYKKEVSDKENTNIEYENNYKVQKTKKRKRNKLMKDESNNGNNDSFHMEPTKDLVKQITNTITANTSSKIAQNETLNISSSPWNERAKISKRLLKTFFHRNSVAHFPGSNIHEIKGYGTDV
ncbi:uncharacterized protein LOC143147226 [Ptiloglossa arizonensis]|uniref:uncharacterized protein LOC143147226 n=1 Tax=Ptiloglossa arizonensis TaxID=3350558 RepID=UPI003FA157B3